MTIVSSRPHSGGHHQCAHDRLKPELGFIDLPSEEMDDGQRALQTYQNIRIVFDYSSNLLI